MGEGLVVLSFCVRDERREQAPPYDLDFSRERGAVQKIGMVGTCPHLISHQYTWRFLLVVGEGLVILSFCVRDERREQAPALRFERFPREGCVAENW